MNEEQLRKWVRDNLIVRVRSNNTDYDDVIKVEVFLFLRGKDGEEATRVDSDFVYLRQPTA